MLEEEQKWSPFILAAECPHCLSGNTYKYGVNSDSKKPRFKCNSCKKTFSSRTKEILRKRLLKEVNK
ncbi:transposase-like zinc-binding domain-containing protein [Paenibacillus sp. RU26A]|uniref:transposase-like zinc-binding domain-containing protein n=1 Tax=Paenibacillus sp. RU26A TaxID=1907393 RepID=UPI0009CDB66E|nr:IS1 family transposase [Paenibacillus tundrae]SLK16123.1 Dof domain-containing protein, zinc finger [Paenibacillus sp. RU5A]SOC74214.1 Dof domain-containing protein, zinc finger [Paenibacillus sp. RU26A]SOC76364.1 Dof domain-containing protein, zinc finger [Paenibacillus sp. RU5M]